MQPEIEELENIEADLTKSSENPLDPQLKASLLTNPFKKLALSLSGGGFRAAAYSLGAMSYLNRLKYTDDETGERTILDNVEFVASASGGTFTGLLYTTHIQKGLKFEYTYHKLLDFLNGQVLLENVLQRVNDETKWKNDKSRNLINAFACIYDEKLFEGETFGVYWPGEATATKRTIEVCFNATEFYRGISFRFQAANRIDFKGKIGNTYIFFDPWKRDKMDIAKKLKLGDIMAASSCFPAGLEPILFPKDFAYSQDHKGNTLTQPELMKAFTVTDYNNNPLADPKNIGLMDGGINDNQAVYSTLIADRRRRNKNPDDGYDLIFVTDVASYFMKPYEAPELLNNDKFRRQSIGQILDSSIKNISPKTANKLNLLLIIFFVFAITAASFVYHSKNPIIHDIALVFCSIFTLSTIVLFLVNMIFLSKPIKNFLPDDFSSSGDQLITRLKKEIPALKSFSNDAISNLTDFVTSTSLGRLEQMFKSRLNSMLSMVLEVNLKQTRRLIFDTLYGEFYGKNIWQNRRVFNVIYELSSMNVISRNTNLKKKLYNDYGFGQKVKDNTWARNTMDVLTSDCVTLNGVAENARTMGTTLWTDNTDMENHRIKDVIACGQFTTCAKLLEYCFIIERVIEQQEKDPQFKKQIQFDEKQTQLFQTIKTGLIEDWKKFKLDPYFIFNDYQLKNPIVPVSSLS